MVRRRRLPPLHAELPEPEPELLVAPAPSFPAEVACRQCNHLMLPLSLHDNARWRCFTCDRLIEVVLPEDADAASR